MAVVDSWTGRHASALRNALRMSNEAFANHLGVAVRTVAKWEANQRTVLTPTLQAAMDTTLGQTTDDVQERFWLLLGASLQPHTPDRPPPSDEQRAAEARLSTDEAVSSALHWLDQFTGQPSGSSRSRVAEKLATTDLQNLRARGELRGRVGLRDITRALDQYYRCAENADHDLYRVRCDGNLVETSILTRPEWLDISAPLHTNRGLRLADQYAGITREVDELAADAAIQRLVDFLITGGYFVNAPLYSLTSVAVEKGQVLGTARVVDFATYALTLDLLEGELADAIVSGVAGKPLTLPLRDRYLPNLDSVTRIDQRLCVGGALALCAIARPADPRRGREADYLLLVQKRSGNVLNAAHRLAVIPKGFHGPLIDYSDDVQLVSTLEREMEEELFGRTDVDNTHTDPRAADPMHPSRLSAPMRWLDEHPETWTIECTGFGFNLVSGNFEAASLITITDEDWWRQFGGHVEANWESSALRQYSSLDRNTLTQLVNDPSWSSEGLFAFAQSLRRLAEVGGIRIDHPALDLNVSNR